MCDCSKDNEDEKDHKQATPPNSTQASPASPRSFPSSPSFNDFSSWFPYIGGAIICATLLRLIYVNNDTISHKLSENGNSLLNLASLGLSGFRNGTLKSLKNFNGFGSWRETSLREEGSGPIDKGIEKSWSFGSWSRSGSSTTTTSTPDSGGRSWGIPIPSWGKSESSTTTTSTPDSGGRGWGIPIPSWGRSKSKEDALESSTDTANASGSDTAGGRGWSIWGSKEDSKDSGETGSSETTSTLEQDTKSNLTESRGGIGSEISEGSAQTTSSTTKRSNDTDDTRKSSGIWGILSTPIPIHPAPDSTNHEEIDSTAKRSTTESWKSEEVTGQFENKGKLESNYFSQPRNPTESSSGIRSETSEGDAETISSTTKRSNDTDSTTRSSGISGRLRTSTPIPNHPAPDSTSHEEIDSTAKRSITEPWKSEEATDQFENKGTLESNYSKPSNPTESRGIIRSETSEGGAETTSSTTKRSNDTDGTTKSSGISGRLRTSTPGMGSIHLTPDSRSHEEIDSTAKRSTMELWQSEEATGRFENKGKLESNYFSKPISGSWPKSDSPKLSRISIQEKSDKNKKTYTRPDINIATDNKRKLTIERTEGKRSSSSSNAKTGDIGSRVEWDTTSIKSTNKPGKRIDTTHETIDSKTAIIGTVKFPETTREVDIGSIDWRNRSRSSKEKPSDASSKNSEIIISTRYSDKTDADALGRESNKIGSEGTNSGSKRDSKRIETSRSLNVTDITGGYGGSRGYESKKGYESSNGYIGRNGNSNETGNIPGNRNNNAITNDYGNINNNGISNGNRNRNNNGINNGYGNINKNRISNGYGNKNNNAITNGYGNINNNGISNVYGNRNNNGISNGYGNKNINGNTNGHENKNKKGISNGQGNRNGYGNSHVYGIKVMAVPDSTGRSGNSKITDIKDNGVRQNSTSKRADNNGYGSSSDKKGNKVNFNKNDLQTGSYRSTQKYQSTNTSTGCVSSPKRTNRTFTFQSGAKWRCVRKKKDICAIDEDNGLKIKTKDKSIREPCRLIYRPKKSTVEA